MIALPDNVEIHESQNGWWWLSNDILYSVGKKDPVKLSKEEEEAEFAAFKKVAGDSKVCMIIDITHAKPTGKQERDKAAEELNKLVKAMAMVTASPLGRMVANLFFGLKPPAYPVKMFTNLEEAEKWIRQYV
ncbi:MAG: STAS/SEC14 domain-containing protein [Bacteroidia bacterium]